jgi:hypothetical protein
MKLISYLAFSTMLCGCSSKEEAPPQRQEGYYPREDMPWFEYPTQGKPKSKPTSQAEDDDVEGTL